MPVIFRHGLGPNCLKRLSVDYKNHHDQVKRLRIKR